jgi:hypothetical protein
MLNAREKIRALAIHHDPAAFVAGADFRVAHHRAVDIARTGHRPERFHVLQRNRPVGADGAGGNSVGLGLAGRDVDDVRAELGEFGNDKLVDAFADRGQQDDGGNAHRDPAR